MSRRELARKFDVDEGLVRRWEKVSKILPEIDKASPRAYAARLRLIVAGKAAGMSGQQLRLALEDGTVE